MMRGSRSTRIRSLSQRLLCIDTDQDYVKNDLSMCKIRQSLYLSGSIGYRLCNVINLAYAENPDDFDTLLLWVIGGGNKGDRSYGPEKTAATRRLYEMNPDHPWVLHYLAKCLLGPNPKEALVYAQRAQERDARYLQLGLEGAC